MSKENVIADSWEDADADPARELMEKFEKVKLLQRNEEKKEAYFEKVKAEGNSGAVPKLQTEEGLGPSVEEPKRVLLRRKKDGFSTENVVESSPPSDSSAESQPTLRGRSHHKSIQKDSKQPAQTYEERQAAYQAARNRILGTEYKPDNQEIKEIKFIDRSKSPETLKMTQQNMVEHYGEELSRELMHPPVHETECPEPQYIPDFSQPPPFVVQPDVSVPFNAPPGFQQMQPNFQPAHQQHFEAQYYIPNNHMPVQYTNQGQMHQFISHDSTSMPSNPQKNFMEGQNEQHAVYYCPPIQQQQMNYIPNNLPNMAYPPPSFPPPKQQVISNMNQPQPIQMHATFANVQMANQYQGQSGLGRGKNGSTRGGSNNGSAGRGQNRQQMTYPGNTGSSSKPPALMNTMVDRGQSNHGQNYSGWNGGNGQRQFQQPAQQNGQYCHQNSVQNNMANGRKQMNKNGKTGQTPQNTNFNVPHSRMNQNPIPFGCPPPYVNAIREQHTGSLPLNTGAGLLGPHPMMAATQWPALSQKRPQ
ncbi:CRE-SZY-20 protein [Caenorhabditis remanei]|uniref:CRE-SZY-20 protein n=1 Tax=Caenorhabditis remanei TaxID=31234 RepID=E3LG37_CAERE|nr:CRE-SZY-20 protein [Caenorhabditis remanei]